MPGSDQLARHQQSAHPFLLLAPEHLVYGSLPAGPLSYSCAKELGEDTNHNRVSAPLCTDLSRRSISLLSRRSERRPKENGSPSRKIRVGNRVPRRSASDSTWGESRS